MKNRNGWPARRRYRREADRIARNLFGYADERSMVHARNVERLREILENRPDSAESELFVTREVADALHSRPKVIRWLACCRHIASEKLPSERARKLWFRAGAIRKYLASRRLDLNSLAQPESRALRSATIAANLHFGVTAVTKDRAAEELRITKHGVEYYLTRGILKRAPSSKRVTLITRKSLASLAWKRIAKAERAYKLAAQKRKKICGV